VFVIATTKAIKLNDITNPPSTAEKPASLKILIVFFLYVAAKKPIRAITKKILQLAKIDYKIRILPWARAYKVATNQPNTLIFSLLRTSDRESKFNWLVPLCTVEMAFYKMGKTKQVMINRLADVKSYKIGIERDQAKKKFLINNGLGKNIIEVDTNIQLRKMMQHNRVDIMIASKSFINNYNNHQADLSAQLIYVYPVNQLNQTLYLASYKATSNALIDDKITTTYQANSTKLQRQCFLSTK
jgi:polar amino acid transport system substrate-binding protein